jgi:hypothetical protein
MNTGLQSVTQVKFIRRPRPHIFKASDTKRYAAVRACIASPFYVPTSRDVMETVFGSCMVEG